MPQPCVAIAVVAVGPRKETCIKDTSQHASAQHSHCAGDLWYRLCV